jgi:hypothetical protein
MQFERQRKALSRQRPGEFNKISRGAYNIAMQKAISNPEPDAADKDFFERLRRDLDHQISAYIYEVPADAIGTPLPADVICSYLNSMRLCLVEAHWEEVNICNTQEEIQTGVGVKRVCVTMAEDKGYVLVFDPVDEEYHLAWRSEHGLGTWGIRGDGVGCFIAR